MKIKIHFFALLMFLFGIAPISVFANRPEIKIDVTGNMTLDLQIADEHPGVFIVLRDFSTRTIYDNTMLNSGKFTEQFAFKGYAPGVYKLEISNPVRTFCYPIRVWEDKIEILDNDCKEFMHPIINYEDQVISLNLMNNNKEHVHAMLFNSEDEMVMDFELKEKVDVHHTFNVKDLESGSYRFEVRLGKKIFSKTFMK